MEPTIINYIEYPGSGVEVLFDSLPEEKQKEIAETLQERMMLPLGYKRKNA